MLATPESKYQFCVNVLYVFYDQDLFDSKVQLIVQYVQISDKILVNFLEYLKFQLYV